LAVLVRDDGLNRCAKAFTAEYAEKTVVKNVRFLFLVV
jgi:hypothetical protein